MGTGLEVGLPELELWLCNGPSLWLHGSPSSSQPHGEIVSMCLSDSSVKGKELLFYYSLPVALTGEQNYWENILGGCGLQSVKQGSEQDLRVWKPQGGLVREERWC